MTPRACPSEEGHAAAHIHSSTLRDYLRVVRRRKWIILQAVVLVPLAAVLVSLRQQDLYESSAQVLLSKADLLSPADRQRMVGYIQDQLRREIDLSLPVYPVSTVGADEEHRAEDRVQKLTDDHTKQIDELLKHKEAEVMEV